ncbi:MAG TPA: DUF6455 family protein [Reyranella sp.]|nr:DUF6455 family protein [Reyranella sp.]
MTTTQSLRHTVSRYVDRQRTRRRLRRELALLAELGCLDEALADAGLLRSQVEPLLAGCGDNDELLERMLARRGIEAARLPVEERRDLTWACTTCTEKRRCRDWLAGPDETGFEEFCPNAPRLEAAGANPPPAHAAPEITAPAHGDYQPTTDELRQMREEAHRRWEAKLMLDTARVL